MAASAIGSAGMMGGNGTARLRLEIWQLRVDLADVTPAPPAETAAAAPGRAQRADPAGRRAFAISR